MSEEFNIKAGEQGYIRLFVVDLPPEALETFDAASALGLATLDRAQTELFDVKDLEGLGLSGYMHEGLGVAQSELDAGRLDALEGHVLIVRSAAFGGEAVVLRPRAPLRWIGTYPEERAAVSFEKLPDASARRQEEEAPAPKKRPSDAAMSGRVATVALLVLFALTGLMIWIGG